MPAPDRPDERVIALVASLSEETICRIHQHMAAGEMGLLLRLMPTKTRQKLLRCAADDLRADVEAIADGKGLDKPLNPKCCHSPYAPYAGDTPEKAVQKYLDVYEGLLKAGLLK
jgi:hypothetical protein